MEQDASRLERGLSGLVVPRAGRAVATVDATLPWQAVDGAGLPIVPVSECLRQLVACGNQAAPCRSYACDLLRRFRFLAAEVSRNRAQRTAYGISCCGCVRATTQPGTVAATERRLRGR